MSPEPSLVMDRRAEYPLAVALPIHTPHPHLLPSSSLAYSGWRVTRLSDSPTRPTYVAFKEDDIEHAHPALSLVGSHTVHCEGYWPFRPAFAPKRILAGTCLYTAAWNIQFAAAGDGSDPRPLSLGLPGDLNRILKFLKKRRPIAHFQIPTQPGFYHRRLITWQAEVLQRFPSIETIHYTLPVPDYHGYILHFEEALGASLPGLHAALDDYVQTLQHFMQRVWGEQMDKVRYDIPGSAELKKINATSRENDLQLYLSAVDQEQVMGIEDLPEVALAHEVARRTGVLIPCAVSVLALPDPYLAREDELAACQHFTLAELR